MIINPPLWLESGEYHAGLDRGLVAALGRTWVDVSGAEVATGVGVLGDITSLEVRAIGNNSLDFTVQPGRVLVSRGIDDDPQSYLCTMTSQWSGTVDASTGSSRIDLVYAYVLNEEFGDGVSQWGITIEKGQPSSTPIAPVAPVSASVELGHILIKPTSQNGGFNRISAADVTDRRWFANDSVQPFRRSTMRVPRLSPGNLAYDLDEQRLLYTDGISWRQLSKMTGTAAQRGLLSAATLNIGDEFFEIDTGFERIWDGTHWTYRSGQLIYKLTDYHDTAGKVYAPRAVIGSRGGKRAEFRFTMPKLRPRQSLEMTAHGRIFAQAMTAGDYMSVILNTPAGTGGVGATILPPNLSGSSARAPSYHLNTVSGQIYPAGQELIFSLFGETSSNVLVHFVPRSSDTVGNTTPTFTARVI